ncbi:MAG TPA: YCF48-related protein, partial [Vicinamibacterales bacterium]|nr:YCF48-related protein [Vicinamibacterales bacterium]
AMPVIVSSNPTIRWRIIDGGAVQRTSDGGATWQTQQTGATETLTAGSSPSPSVCWLVGPAGTVVVSTDDRSWRRVAFPEAVPLNAVKATDDLTAIVTTADGRTFATVDGGVTWR